MHDELVRLGHTVHVYTPIPNTLYPDIPPFDGGHYHLGLLNHSNCLAFLRDKDIDRIVFTSHGVIPQPEHPVEGADVYVAVSEEVAEANTAYGVESVVIRNPIDPFKFPYSPPSKTLGNVMFLSNYGWKVEEVIQHATVGLKLVRIGGDVRVPNIRDYIKEADLVIALGRCVYESLSMGRNVVIYDYQGGDGFVTPENIYLFRQRNCSGRTNRLRYTPEQLRAEIDKYDPSFGTFFSRYILGEHDVRRAVDKYLSL